MARTIDRFSVTLGRILKARGMQDRLREYRVFTQWSRAVGPAIARHAQPQGLRGGKLLLIVDSPAWMQQLSLLKPEILEKLNSRLSGKPIKDITLKLGEVERSSGEESEESPVRPALTREEQERIERSVRDISDEGVRDAARSLFVKGARSRKR